MTEAYPYSPGMIRTACGFMCECSCVFVFNDVFDTYPATATVRYSELLDAHDPSPAKTLASELGENRSTVRTWLRRAALV
jgi:predicted transcriptional regulator